VEINFIYYPDIYKMSKKITFEGKAKNFVDNIKERSLTDDDFEKAIDTNIFTYPYLENVRDIEEVFDEEGRALMLFLTESESSGHWIALLKKGKIIEFFDPYGIGPDEQRKWLTEDKLEELGQDTPLLTNLLRKAKAEGYKIIINRHRFQKDKDDINTCGRHALTRLIFKKLSLPQYKAMIDKSKLSPDEFVSLYTLNFLKK
jgi:hypothetical protein